MKRFFVFFLALVLMFSCSAIGETAEDWSAAPVITCAYEIAKGEIYLEWEGNAPFYGVQVAGKKEKVVNQNSATVKVEEGRQSISVRSLDKNKDENAKGIVDLDINALGGLHIDTDAFGLNSKNMIGGKVSKLDIDYSPSKIHDTMPEKLNAFTDSKGVVHFSFVLCAAALAQIARQPRLPEAVSRSFPQNRSGRGRFSRQNAPAPS